MTMRLSRRISPVKLAIVLILVMGAMLAKSMLSPSHAEAAATHATLLGVPSIPGLPTLPSPCDVIPSGTAREICKGVEDPTGTLIGAIGIPTPGQIIGGFTQNLTNTILHQIALAEAAGVQEALKQEVIYVSSSTSPELNATWFANEYKVIWLMSAFLALGMFYIRIGLATRNSDATEVGHGIAAILTFVALGTLLPAIIGALVKVSDDVISPTLMNMTNSDSILVLKNLENTLTKNVNDLNGYAAILLPLIFLFLGLIGGVLILLELFFREMALYVLTSFEIVVSALAVGGSVGYSLWRRVTLWLIALILMKPIMVLILFITLQILANSSSFQPFLLASFALLLLPFITWAIIKVFAMTDIQASQRFTQAVSYSRTIAKRVTPERITS
jgi:hypothetical protein